MSIPLTQKAVVFHRPGTPGYLSVKTDYPVPSLDEGEVLIKNTFCGVNNIDTFYRVGLSYTLGPTVPGHEAAGTIVAFGPSKEPCNFKLGDRVIWVYKGGYAEYSAAPLDNVIKIPDGISGQDAVGGFLTGLTALTLVKEAYLVKKGEWVLLNATTRGRGVTPRNASIILSMLRILKGVGAKVVIIGIRKVTVAALPFMSRLSKLFTGQNISMEYGDEKRDDWVQTVRDITNGDGVSVAYDFVGKRSWKHCLDVVRTNGTMVWCANGMAPSLPKE